MAFVSELSVQVDRICRRLLNDQEKAYPNKVFVALRPKEATSFGSAYSISVEARGAVRIDIKWDASMDLISTCQGLARAYLKRYLYFREGPGGSDLLPEWVVSALGNQVYIQLRPAVISAYVERLRQSEIPSIDTIFNPVISVEQSQPTEWGFWCFTALRESGYTIDDFSILANAALRREPVLPLLETLLSNQAGPQSNERSATWWTQILTTIQSTNFERYESIKTSREWIQLISDFSDLELDKELPLENLKDVWKHRNEPDLRKALIARREIIFLRLRQVNPAYYNAAAALGGLFETILEADRLSEFIASLSTFLGEFEDTKRLEAVLFEELDS